MRSIPAQLHSEQFLLLGLPADIPENRKRPIHRWKEERGGHRYLMNHRMLEYHISIRGNIGVYCRPPLAVIDIDDMEAAAEVIATLPRTFTVKTVVDLVVYGYVVIRMSRL